MKKRILSVLLVLCLIAGFPLQAYAWDETGTCEFCGGFIADDWICTGGEHCGENSGRSDCYEAHHCHECWDCETEVDEFCAECLLCVACAQENGAHCKECGTCFNGNAEPCPGGCDRCGECADEWCNDCGMCVECAVNEGKHCPDCDACHGDGDYCLLCNRCFDCGDQCESSCTDVCLICHTENEKACENCGACFIVGDNQRCPSCGYCTECVDEWCNDCEMCVECAQDEQLHCPECGNCFTDHPPCPGGCGRCGECVDEWCSNCGMCVECAVNEGKHCPDCNACHGDGDYCLLCNRCLDCGDQCESGCTDVCLICHLENEKACTNCGACFIVGDNQCCPSCGYCTECVDEWCDNCEMCVECAQNEQLHCPECGNCFTDHPPCPGGCGLCDECVDEWCNNCGMCVECAVNEGKHCPDCNACHSDGDYCLLCNRCFECGDQCGSGCPDACLICHLENEAACENCGACFIIGDSIRCPGCENCSDCVTEWCDNCEMCVECAIDDCKHCPECTKCYEEVENYCGGCGKCLDCADAYCPDCNMCSDCVSLCGNCHYCRNDAVICPDCGEACSECSVVCGNCGLCEDCTTICIDCGDYCSDCSTLCGGCQTCEACAAICPDCGEVCSSCGTICDACGLCEECCTENSRMAGCTHGICIMSSKWDSHWSTEHTSYEHTHVYGDYLNNAGGHWRICKVGSCGASTTIEEHSFGYSTVLQSATETQAGLKEYTCTVCSFKSTHTLTYVPAKEATCTDDGNKAYYICSCGKWFNDGAFEEEITDKSDVVLVAGHTASDWKADKDYHWKECTAIDCGVVLEGTKAIHEYGNDNICDICGYDESTTYTIIEGANGKWVKGTEKPLAFKADGQISKFEGIKVDDILIDASKYTTISGSTIVTLKKEYLDTLSVGVHKLTVVYTDGEAITYFAILASESGNTDHVHALTLVAEKAATCTADGSKAYYTCTCGKWFSDKNGATEIADYTSVVLPATGHYYKWIIDKVATETEAGSKHLECRYCHDAKEAVEIPAIGNAAVHQHSYVKEIVPPTCTEQGYTEYRCTCGINFKDNYVNTISHVDADNSGKCDICATDMSANDPGKTTGTDPSNNAGAKDTGRNIDVKSPQTGDSSNLALWIALLFISGGAVTVTTLAGRKKKYNK